MVNKNILKWLFLKVLMNIINLSWALTVISCWIDMKTLILDCVNNTKQKRINYLFGSFFSCTQPPIIKKMNRD